MIRMNAARCVKYIFRFSAISHAFVSVYLKHTYIILMKGKSIQARIYLMREKSEKTRRFFNRIKADRSF